MELTLPPVAEDSSGSTGPFSTGGEAALSESAMGSLASPPGVDPELGELYRLILKMEEKLEANQSAHLADEAVDWLAAEVLTIFLGWLVDGGATEEELSTFFGG